MLYTKAMESGTAVYTTVQSSLSEMTVHRFA